MPIKLKMYTESHLDSGIIADIGKIAKTVHGLLAEPHEGWQAELLACLTVNHCYLRDLGLSCQPIEDIVQQYTIPGHSSAKITGSGLGGCVLIISDVRLGNPCLTIEIDDHGLIIETL